MTLVDFPNFNTFLEDDILNRGYSYLSVSEPISGKYLKDFVLGLMGIYGLYKFLLGERGVDSDDLRNEATIERLLNEDKVYFEKCELDELDFIHVESGGRKILIEEYMSMVNLLLKVLPVAHTAEKLSRVDLRDILLDGPSSVIYGKLSAAVEQSIDPVVAENCSLCTVGSKYDALNACMSSTDVLRFVKLYQECQVLQHGDMKDKDLLLWNIYSDGEVYAETAAEGIKEAGRLLFRLPLLIDAQHGCAKRTFFDDVRLFATRDSFREYIAKKKRLYDEEKSLVTVQGEYEFRCFDYQYQKMKPELKRVVDCEEEVMIRRLGMKYGQGLDVSSIIAPFEIHKKGKGHVLKYTMY